MGDTIAFIRTRFHKTCHLMMIYCVKSISASQCHAISTYFMGDSLTRYQYLDMAYFLSHNGTCISNNDRPNMVIEKTHADWNTFYNFTNSILEPFETCDCFRIEGRLNTATVTENRYFLDTERNNTVTYLQKFGHLPFKTSWRLSRYTTSTSS